MEWGSDVSRTVLLLVSLGFQAAMAIAMTVIGILARRSLAAIDRIDFGLNEMRVLVAGAYYSKEDHASYAASIESRLQDLRRYAREGIHDCNDDSHSHELWIQLIAQHLKLDLPAKAPRRREGS
jgi:hypothetical protein